MTPVQGGERRSADSGPGADGGPAPRQSGSPEDVARAGRRLYAFSRRLERAVEPGVVYPLILRTLARQTGAQTGSLAVHVPGEGALVIAATVGYPHALVEDVRIPLGDGLMGEVFLSRRHWVGSIESLGRPKRLRYRSDSCLVMPIVSAGSCLAVVALTDPEPHPAFRPQDTMQARFFAVPSGLALARLELKASLAAASLAAQVDPLTGLQNRRHFDRALEQETQRARRQGQPLAVLMVDIDNFKKVNDTRGHLAGDQVLREVAGILRQSVRIFDTCARCGGEEFAILMPGAEPDVAIRIAERICRRVEAAYRGGALPITVSIGAAALSPRDDAEDLVGNADMALLAAKRSGKNALRLWSDLGVDGLEQPVG